MGVDNKFNEETETAGYDWLNSFLRRNPELSVRQAQGLSLARANGMNRENVASFFATLETVMRENELFDHPENIFNVDESGLQANNQPDSVIAEKGSKSVHVLTSGEKGENVTVIGCCNAAGQFLPPVLIFKGVNRKPELADGLPPGSDVYMNKKSSYISTDLFHRWFTEHFLKHKTSGKTLLILDGHASHCSSPRLLQTAIDNDVSIICLPSHCTHALQPLDKCFFGPLKSYFRKEASAWMRQNSERRITRYQMGKLIGAAWNKAAAVGVGVSGFESTGIYPLNPNRVPDHFFSISDQSSNLLETATEPNSAIIQTSTTVADENEITLSKFLPSTDISPATPGPSTSNSAAISTNQETPKSAVETSPSKILKKISPVPKVPKKATKARRKLIQSELLTDAANVQEKFRAQKQKKNLVENEGKIGNADSSEVQGRAAAKRKNSSNKCTGTPENSDSNRCCECWENYFLTTKEDDWIECVNCKKWLHESCSVYNNKCVDCGRKLAREENEKKQKP